MHKSKTIARIGGLPPRYFNHPLTTETFDRTPEQRHQRSEIYCQLMDSSKDSQEITFLVNRRMFEHFVEQVQLDQEGLGSEAIATYEAELKQLHDELPLPGLERIAALHNPTEAVS
jgi:hypothetical protein